MNLAGVVDPHPAAATALVAGSGEVLSYGDLRRSVRAFQAVLADAGLRPDDRVAILSTNDPAFVIAYLAILRLGAVAVPLSIASPPAEVQRQLTEVDVAAIVVGPGGATVAAAVASSAGVPVLPVPTAPAAPRSADEAVAADGASTVPAAARAADDLAALLFTAGTAGSPRAAMLSHGNLLANLDQVQRHPGRAIEAADRVLGVLPLSHIFGLNAVLGGALYVGASVVLQERFEADRTLELIAERGVTILVGAPTLFAALTAAPPTTTNPMASVRLAFSGAAPLTAEVADAWDARFHLPLRQGYGLTEASPVVTTAVMDAPARSSSIGVAIPGLELLLVDDDGEPSLVGDPGEIWVRGPNVFSGYWRDPDATEAALTPEGWLRTGDIAVMSDDGELAIVDRSKDLIIVSGFNVYPAEVEEVLAEHPAVADVAVVGDADRYRGEVVHAFVVSSSPIGADALKEWCATRLARYKCPTEVTFLESLPHGLGGKLLRRSLRAASPIPEGRQSPATDG